MKKRNIIIDCDPGHDDALAIMVALAKKDLLDLKGLTIVAGNQTLEKLSKNTLNLLSYLEEDVPVVQGVERPIIKPLTIGDGLEIHGESGLDGFVFPEPKIELAGTNAVHFLYETIMRNEEKITLVPTAPLTNIALLLKAYPEVKEKIEVISLMGGGINNGNITPSAEFNIYADPDAANIVFNSGIPIIMSGLDVTEKAFITFDEVSKINPEQGKCSSMIRGLLDFYGEFSKSFGLTSMPLHDVCSVLYLTNPEIFKGEYYTVDVEVNDGITRGQTVADRRIYAPEHKKNTFVLLDIDREKFLEIILESIKYYDEKL